MLQEHNIHVTGYLASSQKKDNFTSTIDAKRTVYSCNQRGISYSSGGAGGGAGECECSLFNAPSDRR